MCLPHLQWNVVGDSLSLYEVFGLVLGDYVPADSIVDRVLEQDGSIHGVGLIQGYVTAVGLRHAADLQHEHDLATRRQERKNIKIGH